MRCDCSRRGTGEAKRKGMIPVRTPWECPAAAPAVQLGWARTPQNENPAPTRRSSSHRVASAPPQPPKARSTSRLAAHGPTSQRHRRESVTFRAITRGGGATPPDQDRGHYKGSFVGPRRTGLHLPDVDSNLLIEPNRPWPSSGRTTSGSHTSGPPTTSNALCRPAVG